MQTGAIMNKTFQNRPSCLPECAVRFRSNWWNYGTYCPPSWMRQTWRNRINVHLEKRGALWVQDGDLGNFQKTTKYRPNFPETSAQAASGIIPRRCRWHCLTR